MTKTQANQSTLQKQVREFWAKHYGKRKSYTIDERNFLAEEFIESVAEYFGEHDYMLSDLLIVHPAAYKGNNIRYANMYDIIADFIFSTDDYKTELEKEYPSVSEEQYIYQDKVRKRRELTLVDDPDDEDAPRQPYTIKESEMHDQLAQSDAGFHVLPEYIEEFIDELQADIEASAVMVQDMYGGDLRTIKRKLRGLKKENVKVCEVCSEPFYATDGRQKVCNITTKYKQEERDGLLMFIATNYSPCWHKRNAEKVRKSVDKLIHTNGLEHI